MSANSGPDGIDRNPRKYFVTGGLWSTTATLEELAAKVSEFTPDEATRMGEEGFRRGARPWLPFDPAHRFEPGNARLRQAEFDALMPQPGEIKEEWKERIKQIRTERMQQEASKESEYGYPYAMEMMTYVEEHLPPKPAGSEGEEEPQAVLPDADQMNHPESRKEALKALAMGLKVEEGRKRGTFAGRCADAPHPMAILTGLHTFLEDLTEEYLADKGQTLRETWLRYCPGITSVIGTVYDLEKTTFEIVDRRPNPQGGEDAIKLKIFVPMCVDAMSVLFPFGKMKVHESDRWVEAEFKNIEGTRTLYSSRIQSSQSPGVPRSTTIQLWKSGKQVVWMEGNGGEPILDMDLRDWKRFYYDDDLIGSMTTYSTFMWYFTYVGPVVSFRIRFLQSEACTELSKGLMRAKGEMEHDWEPMLLANEGEEGAEMSPSNGIPLVGMAIEPEKFEWGGVVTSALTWVSGIDSLVQDIFMGWRCQGLVLVVPGRDPNMESPRKKDGENVMCGKLDEHYDMRGVVTCRVPAGGMVGDLIDQAFTKFMKGGMYVGIMRYLMGTIGGFSEDIATIARGSEGEAGEVEL